MNAAIRAVVRQALSKGKKVKGIKRGYAGLLNEEIVDMDSKSVSDTISRGGTILQTARCKEFVTAEGQQKGAEICKKHGIDAIVVIGGDGSFQGAQKLAALGINTIGLRAQSTLISHVLITQSVLIQPATQLWRLLTRYVIHLHHTRDAQ